MTLLFKASLQKQMKTGH